MQPITGAVNTGQAAQHGEPPRLSDSFFGVAQSMMPGVHILAAASPTPTSALALVAGHVLECLLKAYLISVGCTAGEVKKIRHNLDCLWAKAFEKSLRIPETPPDWVVHLNAVHDHPYDLRYAEGVHAILLPTAEPMVSGLSSLLDRVREQLGR